MSQDGQLDTVWKIFSYWETSLSRGWANSEQTITRKALRVDRGGDLDPGCKGEEAWNPAYGCWAPELIPVPEWLLGRNELEAWSGPLLPWTSEILAVRASMTPTDIAAVRESCQERWQGQDSDLCRVWRVWHGNNSSGAWLWPSIPKACPDPLGDFDLYWLFDLDRVRMSCPLDRVSQIRALPCLLASPGVPTWMHPLVAHPCMPNQGTFQWSPP